MYEKILATIQKSWLYDFIQVAYSQPLLRNFFTFKFSQIQIVGGDTVIVVMLRHFPQNYVSNMSHDYVPTMPHFFVSAINHRWR